MPRTRTAGTWRAQAGVSSYVWHAYGNWSEHDATLCAQPQEEILETLRRVTMTDRLAASTAHQRRAMQPVRFVWSATNTPANTQTGSLLAAREMAVHYAQGLQVQRLKEALQIIRRIRLKLLQEPGDLLQQDRGEPQVDLLMEDI